MEETRTEENLDALAATLVNRSAPGLFLTFEGGDGCGKTTQIALLAEALEARGVRVLVTREPGGTDLGQHLRRHIQHGPEDMDPRTEALLYAADRAYHAATVLRPALAEGITVLGDRYIDSSVAYQGAARHLGPEEIRSLSEWATDNLYPEVTILLDMDAGVGIDRIGHAGQDLDRLERAGDQFHRRVSEHYREIAAAYPERILVINAQQPIVGVFADIVAALRSRILP